MVNQVGNAILGHIGNGERIAEALAIASEGRGTNRRCRC